MARYRSSGGLDDPSISDGDAVFVGINQRDQPNQLETGEVALSQNGRIDGYWQPRMAIALKSGQLAFNDRPLLIPFWLADTPLVPTAAARSSNVVTLTFSGGHGLDYSLNATAWLVLGDPSNATAPLSGTNNVDAGAYLFTAISDTQLTFAHTGADESLAIDATYGYLAATLDDDAVGVVHGSCSFSDPSNSLVESVFLATTSTAKKVLLTDYSVSDIPYPAGESIVTDVEMIQAFDRVYLFREGLQTLEFIPNGRSIEAAAYTSSSGVVQVTLEGHGFNNTDSVTIADVEFTTTDPNGTHQITSIVDADTFQYTIASGGGDETYTANTGVATAAGFTKVPAGAFTQPQAFSLAGNNWGASANTVTFTIAGNTTIKAGDTITIHATDIEDLKPILDETFIVSTASSTEITFNAPVPDTTYGSGSGSEFVEFSGRFSQGGGFFHSPAPGWGVYFQRRLWVPYSYEPGGTGASPTYTDRKVRDQIAASDILDPDTFDSISSQFRITAGISDYTVGLQPFYDDGMIVLNRNSLHLIAGTQGSLKDTVVKELTREIGCLAQKSVATQGNRILFLSDNGIYMLSFVDEYNLRGVEKPLSEKIQPFMDRLNKSLADKSVAKYFNNRYYIAVPLDTKPGANDAKGNNTVLIYNMLNGGWESIDTYGDEDFLISNMLVAQDSKRNQLFYVNEVGGLHLVDANRGGEDSYSLNAVGSSTTQAVDYKLTSRGYGFKSLERKKYRRAQVQMVSDSESASDVEFLFSSENPDTDEFSVADIASLIGDQLPTNEGANFRFRLGNPRGIYGTLTINRKIVGSGSIGRPKVTSIAVEGYETNRGTLTQQ